jgi:argininosuccinate lyase
MSEEEFRSTLNPVAIVNNRATVGGPQPAELDRMLKIADQKLREQNSWIEERRAKINASLAKLDADFGKLLKRGN